ncbi:helix-turn-helix transcriptional regulator [Roseovarius phycicola]|uniref:LuxR family transcriptional regulator n=1 Tax=Roseovarius phycicola TaxID=3080976 RepID=A0ABZ2HPA3_9RHOB
MTPYTSLIDLAKAPKGQVDFVEQLNTVCDTLGLDYASYASTNPISGKVHAFTTYPDTWKEHYMDERFHLVDPTLKAASRSIAPVDWQRLEQDLGFQSVFNRARDFSLPQSGLTVPVRGPFGDTGLLSVTSELSTPDWVKLKSEVIQQLQTLAVNLHDTVMHTEQLSYLLQRTALSTRELEIMQWIAAGKSQQDVGDILSISVRTVEVHLRSSREKLCTLTTAQAVGRAVSLGLIAPG